MTQTWRRYGEWSGLNWGYDGPRALYPLSPEPGCPYRSRDPGSMPNNARPAIGYHSAPIVTV